MRLLYSLVLVLYGPLVMAAELSIERIFDSPALSGPAPRALKLAPDGARVTFLRGSAEDQNRLDLWEYHIESGQTRLLVDARRLGAGARELSEEEKARRERLRINALSGIVEYFWSRDGQKLLFPLDGALYVYHLDRTGEAAVQRLTDPAAGFVTDPKFSPKARYVSFVRGQNLWVVELASGRERALTQDGGGPISYGVAEFVAQEEMGRMTGYWWAPDDGAIAYTRIDESPVPLAKRFEIYADRTEVIEQRYPYAGTANVRIALYVQYLEPKATRPFELATGQRVVLQDVPLAPVSIPLGTEDDIYLARVQWLPDGRRLVYQRQSRDQRVLDLVLVELGSDRQRILLSERAETWVNLHDDLRFLGGGERFVWASERVGLKQLELRRLRDGGLVHALTAPDYAVDELVAVDERAGFVYFESNKDDVTQKQLYRVRLDGRDAARPQRITTETGFHEVVFSDDARYFVSTYSNPNRPPTVRLFEASGRQRAVLEANAVEGDHPYAPYLDAHQAPEFGTLTGPSGDLLHYRLLKPKNFRPEVRHPVFVRVYGGPHVQYVQQSWDARWGLFDQYMAQQGFLVYSLDNRGSARRGKRFEDALYGRMGRVDVEDQLAGIRWLAAQDYVDPHRIGVFGWSYGGYMTLMLLAQAPELIKAGVAVAPVTDWLWYDTHYTERYMDLPARNPEGYRLGNVLTYVDGYGRGRQPALLLIHGMADDNVLFTHSTQLMAALQERGIAFDLMTYPGGKHGINASPAQRKHVFHAIARHFKTHLKP